MEPTSGLQEQFNALVRRYWDMKSKGAKPEELMPIQQKLEKMSSQDSSLIDTINQGLDEQATPAAPITGGY